jgi:hypothetical protein
MNRFSFILLLSLLHGPHLHSQEVNLSLKLQKELPGKFNQFRVDELGSVYVFTSTGQIKKYNANLDSLAVFNDVKRYGQLYSIHAENPLRTILFFKNFNTVVLLDRMMQMVQKIDLRKLNLFQVNAIAPSYDNRLWVFDQQNFKIKKINFDGSLVFESTDLRLVFDAAIHPFKMIEHQGSLYLLDSLNGVYQFDYYGGFKKKFSYPHTLDIESWGNALIGIEKDRIWLKRENELEAKWADVSRQFFNVKQLYFSNQIAYSLDDQKISLYSFNFNTRK